MLVEQLIVVCESDVCYEEARRFDVLRMREYDNFLHVGMVCVCGVFSGLGNDYNLHIHACEYTHR